MHFGDDFRILAILLFLFAGIIKPLYMDISVKVSWWQQKNLLDIRNGELCAVVVVYVVYAFLYWITIVANTNFEAKAPLFFAKQISVNYGIKLLLTYPFWWLIFRGLRHWALHKRLLMHLPLSLFFVVLWLMLYHGVCDLLKIAYMTGTGLVWDLYIPFILYLLQFGLFHSYEYFNRARQEAMRSADLRQLALSAEINALKAQIQPHFLFNTLNSISASLPPEQEKTRELIAQLADTFRFGLKASQCDLVQLGEEIDFLKSYLALAQHRFGPRLKLDFEVPDDLMSRYIPPMLLQPLVENALQHAVGPSVAPVEIGIKACLQSGRLMLQVADTGPFFRANDDTPILPDTGVGLRNTRLRLQKQFNTDLTIQCNKPQGLIFTIAIP